MTDTLNFSLDGCVTDASFHMPQRVVRPYAWIEHIPFAFWLIEALRPATLVELGTHTGNSFFAFCEEAAASSPETRLTAIDTWQGDDHAGHYDRTIYDAVSSYHAATYADRATLLRMTFAEARAQFAPGSIDLLHIDGLHTYEAVREDFTTWKDAVSARGVVLFHDIAVQDRGFGVWRLWDELTPLYPSFSFSHGNGLGVLAVGPAMAEPVRRLCDLPSASAETLRQLYTRLGRSVIDWVPQLDRLEHELNDIYASRSWQIADTLARVAHKLRGRKSG